MAVIQFRELLRRIVQARLECVVVGGVAATLHGVSEPTRDLDVCIRLSTDSWARVAEVIAPLHPRFALTVDKRPIDARPEVLRQFRNLYVLTDLGRLDFLGEVPPIGDLDAVLAHSVSMLLDDSPLRVIGIDDLVTVKEHTRRPKDLEVAAELKAIRDALHPKMK